MTGSMKADIDELNRLSSALKDLSREVGELSCGKGAVRAFGTGQPGGVLTSHETAVSITASLLHDALRTGAQARLTAVAEAMSYSATVFKDQDDSARDRLAALYGDTTGRWTSAAAE